MESCFGFVVLIIGVLVSDWALTIKIYSNCDLGDELIENDEGPDLPRVPEVHWAVRKSFSEIVSALDSSKEFQSREFDFLCIENSLIDQFYALPISCLLDIEWYVENKPPAQSESFLEGRKVAIRFDEFLLGHLVAGYKLVEKERRLNNSTWFPRRWISLTRVPSRSDQQFPVEFVSFTDFDLVSGHRNMIDTLIAVCRRNRQGLLAGSSASVVLRNRVASIRFSSLNYPKDYTEFIGADTSLNAESSDSATVLFMLELEQVMVLKEVEEQSKAKVPDYSSAIDRLKKGMRAKLAQSPFNSIADAAVKGRVEPGELREVERNEPFSHWIYLASRFQNSLVSKHEFVAAYKDEHRKFVNREEENEIPSLVKTCETDIEKAILELIDFREILMASKFQLDDNDLPTPFWSSSIGGKESTGHKDRWRELVKVTSKARASSGEEPQYQARSNELSRNLLRTYKEPKQVAAVGADLCWQYIWLIKLQTALKQGIKIDPPEPKKPIPPDPPKNEVSPDDPVTPPNLYTWTPSEVITAAANYLKIEWHGDNEDHPVTALEDCGLTLENKFSVEGYERFENGKWIGQHIGETDSGKRTTLGHHIKEVWSAQVSDADVEGSLSPTVHSKSKAIFELTRSVDRLVAIQFKDLADESLNALMSVQRYAVQQPINNRQQQEATQDGPAKTKEPSIAIQQFATVFSEVYLGDDWLPCKEGTAVKFSSILTSPWAIKDKRFPENLSANDFELVKKNLSDAHELEKIFAVSESSLLGDDGKKLIFNRPPDGTERPYLYEIEFGEFVGSVPSLSSSSEVDEKRRTLKPYFSPLYHCVHFWSEQYSFAISEASLDSKGNFPNPKPDHFEKKMKIGDLISVLYLNSTVGKDDPLPLMVPSAATIQEASQSKKNESEEELKDLLQNWEQQGNEIDPILAKRIFDVTSYLLQNWNEDEETSWSMKDLEAFAISFGLDGKFIEDNQNSFRQTLKKVKGAAIGTGDSG